MGKRAAAVALPLPTGGKNGFIGVRGGQGRGKNMFQGTTPNKTNRTKHYRTPREAAVALAELRQNLAVGGVGGAVTNQQHSKQQPVLARFGKAAPILRPSYRVFLCFSLTVVLSVVLCGRRSSDRNLRDEV